MHPTHSAERESRWELLAASAVTASLGSVVLHWPAGRDQGIEAATALAMLDGAVPYRDVWNHSPPGGFLVAALGFVLFGRSELALRAIDLVSLTITAALAFALLRQLSGRVAAWTAALLIPVIYVAFGPFDSAQRDGYIIPLGLGALAAVTLFRQNAASASIAGLLAGAASLFKPGGAALVLAMLWVLRSDPRALFRCVIAALLPPLAFGAYLFATHAIGPFLQCVVAFNGVYRDNYAAAAARANASPGLSVLKTLAEAPVTWLAMLGLWRWRLHPHRAAVLALLAASIVLPLIQAGLYLYHLLPLLGPFILLACVGVADLRNRLPQRRWITVALIPAVIAVHAKPYVDHVSAVLELQGRSVAALMERPGFSRQELGEVAKIVAQRSKPTDRVLLFGPDSLFSLLSQRTLATRYGGNLPLRTAGIEQRERPQLMEQLVGDPPRHVIVQRRDRVEWITGNELDSVQVLATFPELQGFLKTRYRPLAGGDTLVVYERR